MPEMYQRDTSVLSRMPLTLLPVFSFSKFQNFKVLSSQKALFDEI